MEKLLNNVGLAPLSSAVPRMGVPLRVGLFAASPRCAAGFSLPSFTRSFVKLQISYKS